MKYTLGFPWDPSMYLLAKDSSSVDPETTSPTKVPQPTMETDRLITLEHALVKMQAKDWDTQDKLNFIISQFTLNPLPPQIPSQTPKPPHNLRLKVFLHPHENWLWSTPCLTIRVWQGLHQRNGIPLFMSNIHLIMPWLIFGQPSKNHVGPFLHEGWKGSQVGCLNIPMGGTWGEHGPKQVLGLEWFPGRVLEGVLSILHRHCHHQQAGVHCLLPMGPFHWQLPRWVSGPYPGSWVLWPQMIVVKLCQGLNPQIQNAIATMASGRPSDMVPNQWFSAACTIDLNWATNDAFCSSYQAPNPAPSQSHTYGHWL